MLQNKGLAFKLAFFMLSCCAAIFAVIFLYNHQISKSIILAGVRENARNLTLAGAHRIEKVLVPVQKVPENLAVWLETEKDLTEDKIRSMMRSTLAANAEIYGICVAFEPHTFKKEEKYFSPYCYNSASTVETVYINEKTYRYIYSDWYQIPRELKKPYWSSPYYDDDGGKIIMSTYSVPFYEIRDGKKAIRGIVSADISLAWLEKEVSSISILRSGYGFLIAHNGMFVTHPRKEVIMNETVFTLAEEMEYPQMREIGRKMIFGEAGFYRVRSIMGSGDCWLSFSPLPACGWSLAVMLPEDELFAGLTDLNKKLVIIAVSGFIAFFILIVFISGRITSPLRELAGAAKQIGGGDFDVALPAQYSQDEIGRLNGAFAAMQKALKEYIENLRNTTLAKERIESELKVAHDIQMGIIPKTFPPYPDRPEFDVYAVLDPAKEVGGDLYDFFLIDDTRFCFAVGDVAGKGVPASLFMAITRTLLHAKFSRSLKLSRIVESINEDLSANNENLLFVTFFVGILDTADGTIEYCNAGHNPPFIVRRNGQVEELPKTKDTPLGIMPRSFSVETSSLDIGDSLFLFTDGVPEASDPDKKFYGEARLKELLAGSSERTSSETVNAVLADLRSFASGAEQSDDITILQVKFIERTSRKATHRTREQERLVICSDLPELAKVVAFIDTLAEKWGLSAKLANDLNVCLEELIVNTISYGHPEGGAGHEISVDVLRDQGDLTVTIIDDGVEFDPFFDAAPADMNTPLMERRIGGFGIHFVKNLMDGFEYRRAGGRNIVTLTKKA